MLEKDNILVRGMLIHVSRELPISCSCLEAKIKTPANYYINPGILMTIQLIKFKWKNGLQFSYTSNKSSRKKIRDRRGMSLVEVCEANLGLYKKSNHLDKV